MEKRPPACPRQAWMEDSSSQESCSPDLQLPSSCEVTTMQPLKLDASWLPIYEEEQEAVDSILAFVTSPNKEERDKATFLRSISVLCRSALSHGLTQGLDLFCDMYQLAENIKALLEEEPRDQLCTDLRHLSMLALEKLSLVDTALEGKAKSLLRTCFSSVFWLPAEKEMPKADLALYIKTLNSMDSMLRTMVLSFPASRVSKELQGILELLLDFTRCEREAVRERAMARIDVLARVLSDYSTLQANANVRRGTAGPVCSGEIQLPLLGKLLGRLILFRFSEEQTSCAAFHALFALAEFIFESRLKDRADQVHWEAVTTSALCSLSARDCAKASREALLAAAELLKWKTLKHLLQRERLWELGACLLQKSRSRAEDFIHQSLPYLQDPQANVRLAAVRFIGLITRRLREQTTESQADILSALQPLENDWDISVSSLAARTTSILRSPCVQQRPRGLLRALRCCWP
ncbi:uncharacterized protein LOC135404932 [Pseudopipra pipra]|uniref:uncharacterized protein LOC135404932 n=1 Tax=Pseudopipra pipra TaxID=415032 RepID=UPI003139E0F0